LERISHLDLEDWDPVETEGDVNRAAGALKRLLRRQQLSRKQLGRVAVAVSGEHASLREVLLPPMAEDELRSALPFEAKRHLGLEDMPHPILSFQILGTAPAAEEGGAEQIRVLLAAISAAQRDFPLTVLRSLGIEPEVVDLEPLAALNALLASLAPEVATGRAMGLLDLGNRQASFHLTQPDGWALTRSVGVGVGQAKTLPSLPSALDEMIGRVRETMTFYRGRYRREIGGIFLGGGGALLPGLAEHLVASLGISVHLLNPLETIAAKGGWAQGILESGPRYVTACGLCRWWD
jgi:Tfp pilus assembly PilM family ATPase